ncbi:MAG: futalosine hydrolase [Candidatus Baltobacteraceae bacterium]
MRVLAVCATHFERARISLPEKVRTLLCGVGPVEAAARTAVALVGEPYDLVINIGIAGGFEGRAEIGESCVVAADFIELDRENGEALHLPPGDRLYPRAQSDPSLVEMLAASGIRQRTGVTVSRVTTAARTCERLSALGAEVESMEGFAVLRAAEIAHVRALQLRGISNIVGPRAAENWNVEAAFAALADATHRLFAAVEPT